MPSQPSTAGASLATLLASYAPVKPHAIPTLRTILRAVAHPGWGWVMPSEASLDDALEAVPAEKLYGLLDTAGTRWAPRVERLLPRGNTYQRAYCRAIRRLVAHGEAVGLIHPDHYLIAPAWRELARDLEGLVAHDRPHQRSRLRQGFRQLALWATAEGLPPKALPLGGPERTPMARFKASLREGAACYFYMARRSWNLLVTAHPELGLRTWGGHVHPGIRPVAKADWPELVTRALESLVLQEGLGSWCEVTQAGYRQRIAAYLGALAAGGFDVAATLEGLADGMDAARLLFQGVPAGAALVSGAGIAARLGNDPATREALLNQMRAMSGVHEGRASEANPFIAAAVSAMTSEGRDASARDLLVKALAINRSLLGMTDRHVAWIATMRRQVDQLIRRRL